MSGPESKGGGLMAKAEIDVTIRALDVPRVVRTIKAADALARALRAYGWAKLRSERVMRDGDPLPGEWMAVVEAHDAFVSASAEGGG